MIGYFVGSVFGCAFIVAIFMAIAGQRLQNGRQVFAAYLAVAIGAFLVTATGDANGGPPNLSTLSINCSALRSRAWANGCFLSSDRTGLRYLERNQLRQLLLEELEWSERVVAKDADVVPRFRVLTLEGGLSRPRPNARRSGRPVGTPLN